MSGPALGAFQLEVVAEHVSRRKVHKRRPKSPPPSRSTNEAMDKNGSKNIDRKHPLNHQMKHPQLAGRGAVAVAIAIAIATPIVITNAIANCHSNCIVRPPGTHLDGPNAKNGTNAIAWASAPHGQAGCGAGPDRSHLRAHKHRQSAMIKSRLGISPPPPSSWIRLGLFWRETRHHQNSRLAVG